ncbi:MAG TPA: hypothetical protein VGH89_15630 [Pseudonocardia sp.]
MTDRRRASRWNRWSAPRSAGSPAGTDAKDAALARYADLSETRAAMPELHGEARRTANPMVNQSCAAFPGVLPAENPLEGETAIVKMISEAGPVAGAPPQARAWEPAPADADSLGPLTDEDWTRARQALGNGSRSILFGTSKKAIDNAVVRLSKASIAAAAG